MEAKSSLTMPACYNPKLWNGFHEIGVGVCANISSTDYILVGIGLM
jgi:hypothetical protein